MKLTAYLSPVPTLRMNGAILLLPPICFHGVDRDIFTVRTSPRNFMVAAADDDNLGGGGGGGGVDKFQTA